MKCVVTLDVLVMLWTVHGRLIVLTGVLKNDCFNDLAFDNEFLLSELSFRLREKSVISSSASTVKNNNFLAILSKFWTVTVLITIIFYCARLTALPVLSLSVLTANSDGATVGSFDGGGANLTTTNNLSDQSAANRNYVAQYFIPSQSGSYQIGLSASTEDTVVILYNGFFSPSSPHTNATIVMDDFYGTRSPGVTMGTCGAQVSFCPQITETLVGGRTYYVVVTSYEPNKTVSDGVNLYIYGEPTLIGTSTQENATKSLAKVLKLEVSALLQSIMQMNERFLDGAVNRHDTKRANTKKKLSNYIVETRAQPRIAYDMSLSEQVSSFESVTQNIIEQVDANNIILETHVDYQDDANGSMRQNTNFKIASETFDGADNTFGISFDLQSSEANVKTPNDGSLEYNSIYLGAYNIHSLWQNLVIENHLSFGLGEGKLNLHSGSQNWESNFDTKTVAYGLSLTGLVDLKFFSSANKKHTAQLWPTFSFENGVTKTSNLRSSFSYGSILEKLEVSNTKTQITNLLISPKLKFDFGSNGVSQKFNRLTVAPRYLCRRVSASKIYKYCGLGMSIDLSAKKGGYKLFEIQFQDLGQSETSSVSTIFRLPF